MFYSLFRRSPDVVFVCSAAIDETWIRTTALACDARGMRVAVDICGGSLPEGVTGLYRSKRVALSNATSFAESASRRAAVAVTASSGLDRDIFPTHAKSFVHMPHSLASLHMIYPPDAFDGYDVLFASGPHHCREFAALSAAHGLGERPCHAAGYGKLDVLTAQAAGRTPTPRHVLIAPSWGPDNLLDRIGVELATALAARGWTVTVRPHPLFLLDKAPVIERLQALAAKIDRVALESPLEADDAIFRAAVLVGDYSGIGFEFAALGGRPVVSVDVGYKIVNPDWKALGITPVEIGCRPTLGPVVEPDVSAVVAAVEASEGKTHSRADVTAAFLYDGADTCGARASGLLADMVDQR